MTNIIVFKCVDDWKAYLPEDPGAFAFGQSKEEAVGKLVMFQPRLGLNVTETGQMTTGSRHPQTKELL